MISLYRLQAKGGRYYLHEHPAGASSWKHASMVQFIVADHSDVELVVGAMCSFGMMAVNKHDEPLGLVKKLTRWMTNAPEIAKLLTAPCSGDHEHHGLLGDTANTKRAQVYPPRLCKAIVQGLINQLRSDGTR